jgi:hypothetical protein
MSWLTLTGRNAETANEFGSRPGVAPFLAKRVDHLAQQGGVCAHDEGDLVGEPRPEAEHALARRHDVDGHFGPLGRQPDDAARFGCAAIAEIGGPGEAEPLVGLEGHAVAPEICLELREDLLEALDGRRSVPEVRQCRVAPADAEDDAPVRDLLQRGRGAGGDRGMACDRVGHEGSELEPLRRERGNRERHPALLADVLRVRHVAAVEAGRFELLGVTSDVGRRVVDGRGPDLRHSSSIGIQDAGG